MGTPALTDDDRFAIAEAMAERAAILEHDAGLTRAQADATSRASVRVFRMQIAMPGGAAKWVTLIAHDWGIDDARQEALHRFGVDRVLQVIEQERAK